MPYNTFDISFVLDNNEKQHYLFKKCLDTLLKFNKVDSITIIYFNIEKNKIKEICNFIDKSIKLNFVFFDSTLVDKIFPELNNTCNERLRYSSLLRWWLPKLVNCKKIWYFDTDLLFSSNIRNYFMSIQNRKDIYFYAFNRKIYFSKQILNRTYRHTNKLNGGILYINCEEYNKNNMFNDIVEYYNVNAENIYYMNQDGYQYLFDKYKNHSFIEISDEYNIRYVPNTLNNDKNIKIYHFNGEEKDYFDVIYNKIMNNE